MHALPTWQITAFVGLLALAALEGGYRVGAYRARPSEDATSAVGLIAGAVLGLLGLLLGFSFSLASNRYDLRREFVVDEANAIGTAYLRAELLDASSRESYKAELRAYADTRLDYYAAGIDEVRIGATQKRLSEIQTRIWRIATEETRLHPDAPHTALILCLNDLFDTSAARDAARLNEVPPPIFVLLMLLVVVSGFFAGHSLGMARYHDRLSALCFGALIAMVLFAVLDLDRPRRGLILENQQPMITQRQSMGE